MLDLRVWFLLCCLLVGLWCLCFTFVVGVYCYCNLFGLLPDLLLWFWFFAVLIVSLCFGLLDWYRLSLLFMLFLLLRCACGCINCLYLFIDFCAACYVWFACGVLFSIVDLTDPILCFVYLFSLLSCLLVCCLSVLMLILCFLFTFG